MFRKVLVANRGEIAVRAFRAATELGARTVAVFPYEDRKSEHRLKADEAYQIGEEGHPVRAYLDHEAIVAKAVEAGADAIYPGYGFLSENPLLAEACERERASPSSARRPSVLHLTGNKARAIGRRARRGPADPARARHPGTDLSTSGGRGRRDRLPDLRQGGVRRRRTRHASRRGPRAAARRATRPRSARPSPPSATRPSTSRRRCVNPRHIEVQVLADATGEVVHLFERDCSVQRRHQKVVEIAPAPNLDPDPRDRMCADAVAFARSIGYRNAGTVEFLLGEDGRYVFIEMNPRIQVEHTVTEEVTDIDLVVMQLLIASGETLRWCRDPAGGHPHQGLRHAVPDHDGGPGQRVPPRRGDHHDLPLGWG